MRTLAALCLILSIVTFSTSAQAQVTYDTSAYANCGSSCSSLTYSLTVGAGSNRALAVWVFVSVSGNHEGVPVTSVTYAGVNLTQVAVVNPQDGVNTHAELWALPAGTQPTTGTNNVVVTLSTSASVSSFHTGAISVAGVDQTQTFTSVNTNYSTNIQEAHVTVPNSGANDLVFSALCAGDSILSASQTQRFINPSGSGGTTCDNNGLSTAAGGTTYFSWSVNTNPDNFVIFGASFRAAATATKLQLKGGKLQVVAATGTSTPVTPFNWVQGVEDADGGSGPARTSTTTSALPSNTTTGNTIICMTEAIDYANSVSSVTDSQGDTFQFAVRNSDASGGWENEIWYASNITGGSTVTITGTWTNADTSWFGLICNEYAGLLTSNALDQTAIYQSNGARAFVGPVTTNYDRELVFYGFKNGNGLCGENDSTRQHIFVYGDYTCDFIQYTAGQTGASFDNPNTNYPIAVLATFRLSNATAQSK